MRLNYPGTWTFLLNGDLSLTVSDREKGRPYICWSHGCVRMYRRLMVFWITCLPSREAVWFSRDHVSRVLNNRRRIIHEQFRYDAYQSDSYVVFTWSFTCVSNWCSHYAPFFKSTSLAGNPKGTALPPFWKWKETVHLIQLVYANPVTENWRLPALFHLVCLNGSMHCRIRPSGILLETSESVLISQRIPSLHSIVYCLHKYSLLTRISDPYLFTSPCQVAITSWPIPDS